MSSSPRLLTVALLGAALLPASASGYVARHFVTPGETLSGIAAANGLSTQALATANAVPVDYYVIAGTTLTVPAPGTTAPGAVAQTAPASPIGGYRVRVGDTLSGIAAYHGVPMSALAAVNGLNPAGVLFAGIVLRLPGQSAPAAVAPAPAQVATPAAAPVAAPGRLSAPQISSIAAQHGVPGSLAAAIAWQESGFNNAMVSPANARGIMQILPSTWSWVQSSLARGPLNPASPYDNVRAGSLFLSQLLRETNGDPALAAAGYYQGLASVRRIGLLPSTRQYVANVMALRGRFGG